jgi:hypothetical protein
MTKLPHSASIPGTSMESTTNVEMTARLCHGLGTTTTVLIPVLKTITIIALMLPIQIVLNALTAVKDIDAK